MRYALGSLRLLAFLMASVGLVAPALAGGPITSSEVVAGTLAGPAFSESWTFSGTSGNRVLIAAVTTSGAVNTVIRLRTPGGTEVINTVADRAEYQLSATGTWTIFVDDSGLNDAGTYNLSFLNVTAGPLTNGSDLDGGAIASAEARTGQMNQVADFDAFTFAGTAGDRVLFHAVATGGVSFNTNLYLYPPGGGVAEVNTGTGDRLDAALAVTGTYTVVLEDYGNGHAGTYGVAYTNLTAGPLTFGADLDGGTIVSADLKSAAFTTAPDIDAWHFTGTNGDRVVIAAANTSAEAQNTTIYLYPPAGAPVINTTADRAETQLTATGTYTIVIEDSGLNDLGPYNVSLLNVTAGPLTNGSDLDGGAIASAEARTGQMNQVADFDAFTFAGTAGDRVLFHAVATGGVSFNTNLYLYPPGGGVAEVNTGTGDRLDAALAVTGTYTVVLEDYGNGHAGTYGVAYTNLTAGPLTFGADLDGGTIVSADLKSAAFTTAPDIDAWHFTGTNGDRVVIAAANTSAGAQNTTTYLYPPAGAPVINTTADRAETQLTATGTYTIVIEDSGLNDLGPYNVSLLNVTAGPLTNGSDLDGGAIASAEARTGQMNQAADLDAFTFAGTAGDRVLFHAVATGGVSFNTNLYLYPPGGGVAEVNTGTGDRLDAALAVTGTYTVVLEDYGNGHAGTYGVAYTNLTAGPLTFGADLDGGTIVSADLKSAAFTTAPDIDAWHFTGTNGDRVVIAAANTSAGAQNTTIYLYPPAGAPVINTTADRAETQLTATGTYTIVIEDSGLNDLGPYNVSLLNVTAGPLTNGSDLDGGAIASADVRTGQMNQAADLDAFTFFGLAGERVLFSGIATSGASFNTNLYLYPPGGGVAEVNTGTGDRLDAALAVTGTYTVVLEDYGNGHAGTYGVAFLALSAGPLNSEADPDGVTLVTPGSATGQISPAPDFDAFRFSGSIGDTVHVTAVTTSGPLNTNIRIYPYNGPAVVATSSDNVIYVLTSQGLHTIVIEDASLVNTGTYGVTFTGSGGVTGVPTGPGFDRTRVVLQSPSPNPFAESASLAFSVPKDLTVQFRIFDAGGRVVRTLANGTLAAGRHQYAWDGRDESGSHVASGIYYLDLRAGSIAERRKLVHVK